MPWWPFEEAAEEIPDFFSPTSFAVQRLLISPDDPWVLKAAWAYQLRWQTDNTGLRTAVAGIVVLSYALALVLGAAGLALSPRRDLKALFGLFILSQILPAVAAFAISRFRLACMAVFLVGTAWLLTKGRDAWRVAPRQRRIAAATISAAFLLMLCLRLGDAFSTSWG